MEHISLVIPEGPATSRKSLRRTWNQLSRFQRNIIVTLLIALCLTGLVIFNSSSSTSSEHQKDQDVLLNDLEDDSEKRFDNSHLSQDDREPVEVEAQEGKPGLAIIPQVVEPQSEEMRMIDGDNHVVQLPQLMEEKEEEAPPKRSKTRKPKTPLHFKGPQNERQEAVVSAFRHAWNAYKLHAWGHDNLKPISTGFSDWFGLGLTLVDSLDTMYIMGLRDEFREARDWVANELTFEKNQEVNLFETTIRVLGGLLSAYHLSGDEMFLDKATNLGDRLMPAFKTPSGIPFSDTNLLTLISHAPRWSPDSSTSEVTTIQLEFRDLSRWAGDEKYERAAQGVSEKVHELPKKDGLVPIFINANTGTFRAGSTISLGARGDSYYEYLLKQWLQTGKRDKDFLIDDYVAAIDGVLTHLLRTTPNEKHVYVGELISGREFKPKMDHLTCYLPGTLLLGHKHGMPDSHLQLAKDLLETCYQTYMRQPTHLSPEICYFNMKGESDSDIYVKSNDAHNLLRPEFVESLYYFYALTGNTTYQDMGWNIFQAFEKYTKVPAGGYTSIGNVKSVLNTRPRDMMESFYLGETLKYFYLLFSGDRKEIDLDHWVLNTEAHPLPVLEQ